MESYNIDKFCGYETIANLYENRHNILNSMYEYSNQEEVAVSKRKYILKFF